MPKYIVNGKTYNIPDDKIEGFERKYPDANVEYSNNGKTYHIPINKREGFLKQYPNAVAGSFDQPTQSTQQESAPTTTPQPNEEEYIKGFGAGVKQGTQQLGAGLKYAGGEALDLVSQTAKDNADALAALEQMQAEGKDVAEETKTDAKSVLLPLLGHSGPAIDMVSRLFGKKNPIANANAEVATDRTIRRALKETNGDVEAAKALLAERANEQTTADIWKEEAAQKMNEAKPTKGFGAWVGNMVPQMAGTLAGLGLSAVTKSPVPAQVLGLGQMGALTASTAGASMKEARDAGATNGEVWSAGLADAAIEMATEYIPYKGYLSSLVKQAKYKTRKTIADAVIDKKSPVRKELQSLLDKANAQLGGKLFTADNAAKYIDDIAKEGFSELAAGVLQTITPMIYAEPENYPTLWEVVNNGVEGLKGGIFMGAVLSGASNAATNKAQRDRRKQQGFVDVAEVKFSDEQNDTGIAEVLSYDPKTNQASVLFDGEIIPIDNASENIINSHRFTFDEFDRGQIDMEQAESYENGRSLETPQEKNDAYNMYEYQAQNMRRIFGLDKDADVDAFIGDDPLGFAMQRRNENPDDGQAVLDYLNAKATHDGVLDAVNDKIDETIAQSNATIDSRVNKSDGLVHPATLKINDRKVYIVSGNVAKFDDGTIDTESSDESVIIKDAETGETEFVDPKLIFQLDEAIDPEQEKITTAEVITNTIADQAEKDIEGVLPFNTGDSYPILDDQGIEHNVTIVSDNGDGTVLLLMDNEQQPTTAQKDMIQQMSEAYNIGRTAAVVEAKGIMDQQSKVDESSDRVDEQAEQIPEEAQPAPRIPVDEQGEPIYEMAPIHETWSAILEMNEGNEEEAIDTASIMRDNAQAELDKAMKSPKVKGKTVPEIQAAKAEQKALIKQAQDKLNYWTDVANYRDAQIELMKRAEQRANIAKAQAASQEKGRYSEENAALGAPIDFRDYVMRSIATGGVRFIWKDSATGTRGLGSHTGLKSNEERNARIWLLNNENGLYPEEAAEQLLTSYAEELGYTPNIDTMDALSEILDVVGSYSAPSSMFEAAQLRHADLEAETAAQDEADAQARVLAPIAESLGLTLDEYLAWEEMMYAETLPAFEADYEQITAIFVEAAQQEEILNQNNDERSTENADVQSSVHSEGGLSDGSQAGIEVLQGTQVDNGIADSRGAEAGQGDDAQAIDAGTNDISTSEVSGGAEIIGENNWGKIYQWVKGKAVEGANFLKSLKNGYLKGVFYRREIGDIDLFWGNDKVGLSHIINKHIIKQDDFTGFEQAINSISDIIENGNIGTQEDGRVVISKDNYKVVIERTLEGNWIVTAYDKTRPQKEKRRSKSDATRLHQDIFDKENGELVSPRSASSENKDTTTEQQKQEVEQKNDDHRIVFGAFGKDYISEDGKNSFRITQIDGAKRVANVNVNTEAVGADNLEMTFEEIANLFRNGQWIEASTSQMQGADIVTINKDKHTKTGEDLYVAKIKDRVSRDEYNRIKGIAKENNGYYSTAKRGFIFKTEADAEAFRLATQIPSEQTEDAKNVSLAELRDVGSATNDIVEPTTSRSTEPQWEYELTVYDNGSTILERSQIMPNGVPVYDANFDVRAANPREMLDILNNPSNNMQTVLDQVGSRLEQRAAVWDFREKARTEGVNGFKVGDTVKYTYNGKQEVGTIYDFEDYGDHNPILDLGTAPVLYVSAQWDQVEKTNEQPTIEQPKTSTPSGNKLVTDERYEELKRKMRQKLGGQMNMGIDPEILAIGTEMAVYHIEKGARKFADYASAMIADLGDMIRPYLKAFYNGARELPEVESAGYAAEMTSYDDVRTFDVANFDKDVSDAMSTAEAVIKEQEVAQQVDVAKGKIKNNRNKARKPRNKSVPSSEVMDLFGSTEQVNTQEDDLRGDDAVRTEGLPADSSGQPLGLRESERGDSQGTGQESGRPDGARERSSAGQDRTLSSGLLEEPKNTRNNHVERGEIVAPTSVDARIEANIRAIELSQQLIANEQEATPEQMVVLRRFSGWGGLGKAFNYESYSRRIQELLGADAYQEAIKSANSSYYTPTYVVDTLWDIAKQLGFEGGNILEGSAGIGNILGQMPTDISQRSDIRAIEIDSTAGNILSLLYPDAQVNIQGFEQTHIPNGSVDLAITNVPFVTGLRVNDTSGDKDLSKKFHNIHDFCIAKNVRKLREGGIGIFITSNGTLDNSNKLREWVVNQGGANFVGAFRLNNKTFIGTSVTSDIIVIRKRVNAQVSPNAIDVNDVSSVRSAEYDTGETRKVKGVETPIIKPLAMDYNKYFIDNPNNMAGEMRFGFEEGDTFRPTSKGLYPTANKDQSQMLQEFVQSFTPEAFTARHENGIQESEEIAKLLDGKKLGEVFVNEGNLYITTTDGVRPLDVNSNKVKGHSKAECFSAYAAIKDAVREVLDYQTQNASDKGLQPLLDKLNKAYDNFVKTYGHFNKNTAIAFLRNDVDYPNVFSLEIYDEIGDGKGGRIQKFKKSDVFKKRVIEKQTEPQPTNIKDGIIASIFKFGRIDIPYLANQLNKSEAAVKEGIVESGYGFENPVTREVEVSFQYLSGNIREKLRQAEDNNDNGQYDGNIKALQKVVPMDIPAHLIDFTLGSSWVNPRLYDEYVKDRTDIDVQFTSVGGTWFMDAPEYGLNKEKNRAMGVVSTMLHKTIMGHTLIEAAIQNRTITVSQTSRKWDGTTETITDKEATQACAAKIDEIRQDFKDWARQKMQSDMEMSAQMERVYNDTFNNYVPMTIPDEFIPEYFGGATHKFKMRPHQGRAIVRGTMQPLMLAHEVGTGKTFTLISIAMEMRRLGTARKPMIVVQNATVGQFVASAKELYPNAKILTLEEGDRSAEGRKNFYAKIRYNDWDMIVVPQSTFEFIPDSEERQIAYIQDKIDEKMAVLDMMKQADGNSRSLITRQAEKEIEDLETQLAIIAKESSEKRSAAEEKRRAVSLQNAEVRAAEMLDRRTDDVENFDDMGIDALLIDEAHEYKHLGFATAMQRGVKGVDPSYSKKSQGVYLKTQAVMEKNNGKNVIFATGTPISNTAAEIWTFMRYLMPEDTMIEYGIYYFDDFVRNFGNIQQMLEFTTSGKFKESNRFAGYVNLPELIRIWSGVSDTVLTREAEDVSNKIPEIEGGKAQDLYLPQTRALRGIMKFVKAQLEAYDKMSGKQKKENSHIPLTMYGIAKAAAVDARLVQSDAEDDVNSKTNEAVRQTLRSLQETEDYKGAIAIFADNYQNKRSGFNIYEDIRSKLIDQGVPASEVVVIKPGLSVKRKLEIFDKVNKGEIRVVLGSTFTLGTGVNIQERLHTLIHLDAPNRPMDYTQRNGRILRQGNLHKEMEKPVRILRFGVEDSLDVTAYQRLKTKGAIADSVMNGKQFLSDSMANRVLEEEEDAFGDTVAQLSGSEYAMLKNNAEKNVRKYESRRKQWEADQTYIHNAKPRLASKIENAKQILDEQREYLDKVQREFKDGKFKAITIGKDTFASVSAMDDFIKEYNKTILDAQKQLKDGALLGPQTRTLPIKVDGYTFNVTTTIEKEMSQSGGQLFSEVHRKMSYSCVDLGLENIPVRQSLLRNAIEDITENVITGKDFEENIEALEHSITSNQAELDQLVNREGKPFEFNEELEKAKAQYKEYSELMKKEMEEKEAKYAEMDASVEAALSLAEAEEDGEYRYRVVSYDQQFADLQAEYDALDKNDAEALNEWREKKTSVVRDYLSHIKDRFGMRGELIVFNGANEEQIQQSYQQLIASYEVNGNTNPPTYEAFKEKSLRKNVVGTYRKGGNAITFNATADDTQNRKMQFAETMFHENAHRVSDNLYSDKEFESIWAGAKKSKDSITKMVNELYENRSDVAKGKEYIAKAVGYLANKQKDSFMQFLRDEMPVEELLKKLRSKSEIAKLAVEETLNIIKDEYRVQLSRRGNTRGVGGVGYGSDLRDSGMVLQGDGRAEQGRRTDNAERGLRGRVLTAATDLAASLDVKLNIIEDVNDITDRNARQQRAKRGAKAWYDVTAGQVYFVLPNATSVEDAVQTVLHEVVAHKGLRDVVGREHFEEFLGKVFRAADTDTRRKIVALAAQNGWDFNVATEEYLASLAEEGFDSRENRAFLQKVRDLFMDMLRAAKIALGFNINDNDLRYMLWRTYQMQRSQGAMAVAEDVVMQQKLGVGNYTQEAGTRFRITTGNIQKDKQLGEALYVINKEAKRYRDLKSAYYENENDAEVLAELQRIVEEIDDSLLIDEDGYYLDFEGKRLNAEESREEMNEAEVELNNTQYQLDEDEDLTDEEREDLEYDLEYWEKVYQELADMTDKLSEAEDFMRRRRNVYDALDDQKENLYNLKQKVLDRLIVEGSEDGIHTFPDGSARKMYNLGGYLFHGRDIRDELSSDEYNVIEELPQINAESKSQMLINEALSVADDFIQSSDTSFRVADITYGNFYDYTKATFNEVEKPAREADYTSNSGSRYWYGEDKNGQYVVRGSNHWSGIGRDQSDLDRGRTFAERNGRNTLIGSCQWELISNKTSKELRDSYPNPIYGKVYLKDMKPRFENAKTDASSNEREQIIADATANGIYLKAPNGKDTNLTPDQWVTVRTDAFKKWFGDWENDPTNASKVIDTNGEPKVVYNGSKVKHYNYDGRLRTKGQSATNSKVSFFTDNKAVAERYGKFVNEVFLNIRNPYEIDYNGAGWQGWSGAADGKQRASTDSYADLLANGAVDSTLERIIENYGRAEADYLASGSVRNEGVAPDGVIAYEVADPMRSTLYIVRNAEAKDISRNSVTPKGVETFTNLGKSSLLFDSQIKSATGNMGTFDPSNDDIRYRVTPSTPSTGEARRLYDDAVRRYNKKNNVKKTENLWHHLREAYQDSMLSVQKLMEAVLAETGNTLRSSDDVYKAENQLSSKNKTEIEKWERDFMKPLQMEILNLVKKGASYDDIVEYLMAKHGLERNLEFSRREDEENGKEWDGSVKRDYSGLTELTGEAEVFTEAAQQIVDEFEDKYNTDNLWSKINAATKESLRKSYDSGLMNKEAYDKVSTMFKYYVPLRGWDSNVAADQYEYMGNKGMKILPVLKTAKGRTSRADDPIATLGSVGESSIIQGNRNLMKLKFLNFAQNNPTSLLTVSEQWYEQNADGTWKPSNPEIPENASADEVDALIKEHEAKMEALGNKATKKRQGLNIDLHTTKWEQEEHAVNVKRNGKEYKIFVNGNPIAAQAINGFTNPNANKKDSWEWIEQRATAVKNFMARAFTSMNPAFIFTNLARDLVWAGTSVAIKENAAYARQYTKNISEAMIKAQLPRLVSKWKNGTLDTNVPIEKYFNEFVTNGGETGFTQLNTVDDYKRNMERFIKEAQGGTATRFKKGWRWIWDNVEFLNRSAEDTTRFMVYLTSRQMGRSITESVANAKDITVNFNKKGRGTMGANVLGFAYIFFNATIQSLANFGKLVANNPKKTTAALTTFASSGMIAPMVALSLQAMLSGDDDEPTYWDLPEWVRRNNIVIYVGGSGYVTIPLPHELRPFYGMGELAFSTLMGKEEPETAIRKATEGFASLMPFDYTGNAGNAIVNFTPTIAQPLAQLVVNKDYFGTPIYRKTAFNEMDPEWTKAYKSTNQYLVDATEFVNELTGGDEVKSGIVDLNPAVIEHLFEGYLGGVAKTINRTAKTFSMLWDEDARAWRNVPVLSSFYNEADERTSGSQVNREYFAATDEADEVGHLYSGYKKRAKMGSMEYAEKLNELVNSDVFKRYQTVNSYQKAINKLNAALKEADATDREEVETLIMELKVDMLEELETLNNK